MERGISAMEHIILYGSKYGSTRQYAEALSKQTGIPALRYQDAPNLSDKKTIIYLGGLYAGGILGLSKTFRGFSLRDGQRLIIITVGLSDPAHPETRESIRRSLRGQISDQLLRAASVFHLRGGIDYQTLSRGHRLLMSLLFQSVRRTPEENRTAENQEFFETYGKKVTFVDFGSLAPILQVMRQQDASAQ